MRRRIWRTRDGRVIAIRRQRMEYVRDAACPFTGLTATPMTELAMSEGRVLAGAMAEWTPEDAP